jgi:hypothetical protein
MHIGTTKYMALPILLCVIPAFPSGAATVSIMVIETGGTRTKVSRTATIWEAGMMSVLFEAGHIVSNAPAVRIPNADERALPTEARREFEEAANGGADYFIMILLFYKDGFETLDPEEVSLRLYKIRPYGILYSEKYANKPLSGEIIPDVGILGRMLVSRIEGE